MRKVESLHEGKGPVFGGTVFGPRDLGNEAWRMVDFWRLPPRSSIGADEHKKGRELYYIVSGRGLMTTNRKTFPVVAGDIVLNEPGDSHGIENTSEEDLLLFVTAVIEGE